MGVPLQFKVGQEAAKTISGGFRQAQDTTALDKIFKDLSESGNDQAYDTAISQILKQVSPQNREQAFKLLQDKRQRATQQSQAEAAEREGIPAGLSPELQKEFVKQRSKGKEGLEGALNVIQRQKQLLESGHLGPKIGIGGTGRKAGSTFSKEGREARSEYEQLGKSLISQATTIPIRNRLEFETLSKNLIDPKMTQEQIRGTLAALERIIMNNLGGQGQMQQGVSSQSQSGNVMQQQQRPQRMITLRRKSDNKTAQIPYEEFLQATPDELQLYEQVD